MGVREATVSDWSKRYRKHGDKELQDKSRGVKSEDKKLLSTEIEKKIQKMILDTMPDQLKLPGPYEYKWPKLSELHIKLFGEDFDEAHDASVDINATEKCFWKMREIGLI